MNPNRFDRSLAENTTREVASLSTGKGHERIESATNDLMDNTFERLTEALMTDEPLAEDLQELIARNDDRRRRLRNMRAISCRKM